MKKKKLKKTEKIVHVMCNNSLQLERGQKKNQKKEWTRNF